MMQAAPGRSRRLFVAALANSGSIPFAARIENWLADVESAAWVSPQDISQRYATASFPAGALVIFNVKGNAYRLEVSVAYRTGVVAVNRAGTHAEYDERNKRR